MSRKIANAVAQTGVRDVFDGRLAVDASQQQTSPMANRGSFESVANGSESAVEGESGSGEVVCTRRQMKRLEKQVIQQKSGIEGRVAVMNTLPVDHHRRA